MRGAHLRSRFARSFKLSGLALLVLSSLPALASGHGQPAARSAIPTRPHYTAPAYRPTQNRPGFAPVQQRPIGGLPGPRPQPIHPAGRPAPVVSPGVMANPLVRARPTHWQAPVTNINIRQAHSYAGGFQRAYPAIYTQIQRYSAGWHGAQLGVIQARWNAYRIFDGSARFRAFYRGLDRLGFFGGYWYPVRPCLNITAWFHYPILYWFYAPQPYVAFYQAYYGPAYARYPVRPFPFVNALFPTDTLRDLGIEMSGRPIVSQFNFRESMGVFLTTMRNEISASIRRPFVYQPYSVVINRYVNAGNNAIVVEGFVASSFAPPGQPFRAFKAWLDLTNPRLTLVVVPAGPMLAPAQQGALAEINRRMTLFGLNPLVPPVEPPPVVQDGQIVPGYAPNPLPATVPPMEFNPGGPMPGGAGVPVPPPPSMGQQPPMPGNAPSNFTPPPVQDPNLQGSAPYANPPAGENPFEPN